MATTAERLTHLNTTKGLIRNAIEAKGVDVPASTPFRQYASKIAAIPQEGGSTGGEATDDGWTRPADRPAVPTVNENEIYMLFGVIATGPNDYAITLMVTGGYKVDWGDGAVETIANGVKCQHMYDYASLAVTPNTDGVKWVWIKFTPVVANPFTTISTNVRHSSRPTASSSNIFVPQVYEIYMNAPGVYTWTWSGSSYTRFHNLEIFDWQGTNKLDTCAYFLAWSYGLKKIRMDASLENGGLTDTYFRNLSYFLQYSTEFNSSLDDVIFPIGRTVNISYFLAYCYSFNQSVDFLSKFTSISGSNILNNCYSFNKPIKATVATGSNVSLSNFMTNCYNFNNTIDLDMSNGGAYSGSFSNMYSFTGIIIANLLGATTNPIGTSFIGTSNFAQTGLRLLNMSSVHTALTISNSNLDVVALVLLFGDLYDGSADSTTRTLTITGVFGANKLTKAQLAIATAKNWTVVGAATID